jgi:hypothetical protein
MKRFFETAGQKIPIRRDEATELWLETDTHPELLAMFTGNGGWVVEGAVFSTNRLGTVEHYQITLVEYEIEIHQARGKWGQLRRRAVVSKVDSEQALLKSTPDDLAAHTARQLNRKGTPQ